MRKSIFGFSLLLLASAACGGAAGSPYALSDLRPLDIYVTDSPSAWSATNATALYPLANGHAAAGRPSEMPVALDTLDSVAYRLEHSSAGMPISEQKADFAIGQTCTYVSAGRSKGDCLGCD